MPFFLRLSLKNMIEKELVEQIALVKLGEDSELFVVEIKVSRAQDIEILVDSDTRVCINQCADLSKAIEAELIEKDPEADFSLTVMSAGIGQPLKVQRQFDKCIGKQVEVVLKSGAKVTGELFEANEQNIILKYSVKEAVEGKKRKELVEKQDIYTPDQVKSVSELLTIK